jgi:DNA-binding CsgD family transcriptional regulator
MTMLASHFRRAVLIGRVVDLHTVEAAALADALDGLAAGMFLVDADARLTHANASGYTMLANGDVLRNIDGTIAACDPSSDRALRDIFATAAAGDQAMGARGISVTLPARGGETFVAHVLPLTCGTRRQAGIRHSAAAAMFVHKTALAPPHPLEALASEYDLTPAEMRVLIMIVEIGGVPDVAPVLGVSETTVKTHLRHVFEKTGTRRQADLVKLVAGFMSPLAG